MSIENKLEKYTSTVKALEEHKEQNQAVFDTHQKFLFAVIDAENELRDEAAEAGHGTENEDFKVTVTPQTMKTYDEEKLKVVLTQQQFDDIVKEQTRPARISISPIKK